MEPEAKVQKKIAVVPKAKRVPIPSRPNTMALPRFGTKVSIIKKHEEKSV